MVARPALSERQIRHRLEPFVARAAHTPGADRYRKRFTAYAHLWVLLVHVLWQSTSLRITHARLAATPRWWQRWGMQAAISFSQLARSSSSRPVACVETALEEILVAVRRQALHDPLARTLAHAAALDSTFIRLSAKLSPWSVYGKFTPGVRVQALLELGREVPDQLRLTLADINDHTALWQRDLTPWRGWTLLFDLGYYGHQQLERLGHHGVHFITRLQPQASFVCTAVRGVPVGLTPDGDTILRDWTIRLGSTNNRRGAVVPGLRLVSSRNQAGQVHHFVTDRFDLSATEVVMLYRRRWRIELFFRWLKYQLGLTQPLGHTRAAVWLTVLVVLIVALLLLLFMDAQPPGVSRVAWLSQMALTLLIETIADG